MPINVTYFLGNITVSLELPFRINFYPIETSQPICKLTSFYMTGIFTERYFQTHYNFD